MSDIPADLAFLQWLIDACGCLSPKPINGGTHYAAVLPMAFTHSIITARMFDGCTYDRRWCYHTREQAKAALDAWDGTGEPTGWHRDPVTGRRVSERADEYDDNGKRVGAIGVMYYRP